jgi:uncharacterized membrane protein
MTSLSDLAESVGRTTRFPESQEKRKQYEGEGHHEMNLSSTERNVSIAAGAALGVLALSKPPSLRGLLSAAAGGMLLHRGLSGYCALYNALGLNTRDRSDAPSARPEEYFDRAVHVEHSITINQSPEKLYAFWRDFENLPRFMEHLKEVKRIDDRKSHWIAVGPMNYSVEWDAEVINDEPGKLIAWRSIGSAEVDNAGSVRFIDAGNGSTELRVVIDYIPPAGSVGWAVAKLFRQEPKLQVKSDLEKLKTMLES